MKLDTFLPKTLTDPILEWLMDEENREKGLTVFPPHESGPVRGIATAKEFEAKLESLGFPMDKMKDIEKYIFDQHKILPENVKIDPKHGTFISYSEEGHVVGDHKDSGTIEGFTHSRFNIMISKPIEGGNPIINDIKYEVEENQVWLCPAGKYYHNIDEVKGDKPRIMLSLGYFLDDDTFERIYR